MAIRESKRVRSTPTDKQDSGAAPHEILERVVTTHADKRTNSDLSVPTQKSIKSVWESAYTSYRQNLLDSPNGTSTPPMVVPISMQEAAILVRRTREIGWGATLVWHEVLSSVIRQWNVYFDAFAFRTYNKAPIHPEPKFIAYNWRSLVKQFIDMQGKEEREGDKAGELVKRRKEERESNELQTARDGLAAALAENAQLKDEKNRLALELAKAKQIIASLKKHNEKLEEQLKFQRGRTSRVLSRDDIAEEVKLPGKII